MRGIYAPVVRGWDMLGSGEVVEVSRRPLAVML